MSLNNKSKDERSIMKLHLFEEQQLRTVWDSEQEKWYISIVDVIAVLTESRDANA